jgi:hypothetical protein
MERIARAVLTSSISPPRCTADVRCAAVRLVCCCLPCGGGARADHSGPRANVSYDCPACGAASECPVASYGACHSRFSVTCVRRPGTPTARCGGSWITAACRYLQRYGGVGCAECPHTNLAEWVEGCGGITRGVQIAEALEPLRADAAGVQKLGVEARDMRDAGTAEHSSNTR